MFSDLEKFARFLIAQRSDQTPVTFARVAEEVVCLAFDLTTQRLVELHVLNQVKDFNADDRQSFEERTRTAMELHDACLCRIIDVGEFEGMRYYATSVNDGEFLKDYIGRVAPVDVPLALSLMVQLCDAVGLLQRHARLLNGLRLSNLLVCRVDESHIALRMLDLGLAKRESTGARHDALAKKMAELSQILFYLLSGKPYVGNDPTQVNALAGLPANLKVLLRQTLDGGNGVPLQATGGLPPATLEAFRNELAVSYSAVTQRISRSVGFRPLAAPPRLHPVSMLTQQFFGDLDLDEQLGERYRIIETPEIPLGPYTRLAEDLQKERETIVQFLPAARTLPIDHSPLVITAMQKIKEDEHPNLIRCRGFWETDRLACIAEEPANGFPLPLLLAERGGQLETPEIVILLRQLVTGIEQAASINLYPQSLSIHSLEVHFVNESRFRVRELRKRHVDFWPEFLLKLRCHSTLESAASMPPAGRMRVQGEPTPSWLATMDFIGVAEQLALGDLAPVLNAPVIGAAEPEHVTDLRAFFSKQYEIAGTDVEDFDLSAFVEGLEAELVRVQPKSEVEAMGTIVDGAIAFADAAANVGEKRKAGTRGAPRPMESVGALASVDDDVDSLNPIARTIRGAEQEESVSLGVIDDLDYDIGDSRDQSPGLPGLPGKIDESASSEEATTKKSGKRKGWFFLK